MTSTTNPPLANRVSATPAHTETILNLTGTALKAIRFPEALYPKNVTPTIDQFKEALRKLRSKWHALASDSTENSDTFTHVCGLLETGLSKIEKGLWGMGEVKMFATKSGSICYASYVNTTVTPGLHTRYEGRNLVHYLYPESARGLVKNLALNFQSELGIRDVVWTPKTSGKDVILRKEFQNQLSVAPEIRDLDAGLLVTMKKPSGFVNLSDLIRKFGPIPEVHVRWLISRLSNLCCFMQVTGVLNLSMSTADIYVNPIKHSVVLLDGWQYMTPKNPRLTTVMGRTLSIDPKLGDTRTATPTTVGKLLKALAREMLGDIHGAGLLRNKDIPSAITYWATSPTSGDLITDYQRWDTALNSVGKRQFINWDIDVEKLYE